MATNCAACGSVDTQALADRFQCLTCGAFTRDGVVVEAGLNWTSDVPPGVEETARKTAWAVHERKDGTATPEPVAVKAKAQRGRKKK
jgi:hypothetical protein